MDCTLCLDCVHACPHDNIGIILTLPASTLWRDPQRSGVGRFSNRFDLAILVMLLVFGAFANAAGMVGPVNDAQEWLQAQVGWRSAFWIVTAYYLTALIAMPALMVGGATLLSHSWGRIQMSRRQTAGRYVYALLPVGFAMWVSHYSFHLLMSYDAAIPAAQRFAADAGLFLGSPDFACACCRPVMHWLPRLEILFLDAGLLLSLYTGYRIALNTVPDLAGALKSLAPWALLILLLFAAGIWIVLQPMQMRGVMQMAG
jgi:hypothetical protein